MDTNAYPYRVYVNDRLNGMYRGRAEMIGRLRRESLYSDLHGVTVRHEGIEMSAREVLGLE